MPSSDYGRHLSHTPLQCRSKKYADMNGYVGAGGVPWSASRVVVAARDMW